MLRQVQGGDVVVHREETVTVHRAKWPILREGDGGRHVHELQVRCADCEPSSLTPNGERLETA
jgi:hypothetical protein